MYLFCLICSTFVDSYSLDHIHGQGFAFDARSTVVAGDVDLDVTYSTLYVGTTDFSCSSSTLSRLQPVC